MGSGINAQSHRRNKSTTFTPSTAQQYGNCLTSTRRTLHWRIQALPRDSCSLKMRRNRSRESSQVYRCELVSHAQCVSLVLEPEAACNFCGWESIRGDVTFDSVLQVTSPVSNMGSP